ncbi:hypothetical protein N7478_009979 [Penicillium angulare]|uniref:uncharacterized protein n=1 Tax=Penicillium angulare TaxID=116970 RepID=UPI00253F910D|nr:uncharacterized protein N7478_009979 [Penicillium angulare]KAJ5267171.1 hypothetical protein N7478_009979 [Penicillium angulare]
MRIFSWVSILSLAALGTSQPAIEEINHKADDIPYGAFPSLTDSFVLYPIPTPGIPPKVVYTGRAVVYNRCSFPVYVWSVGSIINPEVTVLPFKRYEETFHRDVVSGGIAIKVSTKHDGLFTSAPLTIFAYNLAGDGKVWYDLSDVFGDPFEGHRVSLDPSSPGISWVDGKPTHGSQVRVHDAASDLVLKLC